MENIEEAKATRGERPGQEIRDELFRILDEIGSARADRTQALNARFKALWTQVCGEGEPTLH